MMVALGLPDAGLLEDLCCGAPAIGAIKDSGCFRAVEREPTLNIHDLDHDAWNTELAAMVEAKAATPSNTESTTALWLRTMKEVQQGYAVHLGSKAEVDMRFGKGRWRAAHRFAVVQNGKIRGRATICALLCTTRAHICTRS